MSAEPSSKDLDEEVQGFPLTGYDSRCMRTLVLAVKDAAHARAFIGELLGARLVDFGGTRRTKARLDHRINIGFTYDGLRALRLPEQILAVLKQKSAAFGEGASQRAPRYLGDAGESSVERWDAAFQPQRAHVWISIHSDDDARAAAAVTLLRGLPGAADGLAGWDSASVVPVGQHLVDANDESVRHVHFGFRDNLTKPSILDPREDRPRPGELLIGYPNNDGADPWTASGTPPEAGAFLRNGSFGVLRKIQQHESRFERYLEQQLAALSAQDHGFVTKEYLKAKMCGRWPDGPVIGPHEKKQPETPARAGDLDKVDFQNDPRGWGCPFGAHIRRTNPRTDPLKPERDRALFRRSVPYGPRYQEDSRDDVKEDVRGLIGVFFCARIEDQFEHLVSEWIEKNPMGPPNRGRAKDPIAGRHDEPGAEFHIPVLGSDPIVLRGLVPFVRTRGTLYALFPSRRALETIATGDYWRQT